MPTRTLGATHSPLSTNRLSMTTTSSWALCGVSRAPRRSVPSQSGTIEEFNRAKARFDADPDSVRVMVYFKDSPIEPSRLDLKQMQAVADFRSRLGEEGGLYWRFRTVDEFEKYVRLHLTRHVEEWRKRKSSPLTTERDSKPIGGKAGLVALAEDPKDDEECTGIRFAGPSPSPARGPSAAARDAVHRPRVAPPPPVGPGRRCSAGAGSPPGRAAATERRAPAPT